MLAGLGAVVAETADVVVANQILGFVVGFQLFQSAAADLRVEIVAVFVFDFQKPAHMVDAGDQFLAAGEFILHAQVSHQFFRADLNTVAQADGLDRGVSLHETAEHSHGIGVVEEPCVGTNLSHIPGEILHHRDSSQCSHDAADAQGICDGLAETVFFRNLEINNGTGIVASHLNGVDHKVGTSEGLLAIFHTQISFDGGTAAVCFIGSIDDRLHFTHSFGINVVECELAVLQCITAETVA